MGEDVENILLKLIQAADYDIESVQHTESFILMRLTRSLRNLRMCLLPETFPVKAFSRHYLKILEGTVASVPPQGGRKHPHQELLQIDTTNILFICGGAFDGLEKIVESRLGKRINWIWR